MEKLLIILSFISILILSCRTPERIDYEDYLDSANDWVVYYQEMSLGESIQSIDNEPYAILSLNESDFTYEFHSFNQEVIEKSAFLNSGGDFSKTSVNMPMRGPFYFESGYAFPGFISSPDCEVLQNLEKGAHLGTIIFGVSEKPINDNELDGRHYHVRARSFGNGKIELELVLSAPGRLEITSTTIKKRICNQYGQH